MEIRAILTDLHRCGYFDETANPCGSSLSVNGDRMDPQQIIRKIKGQWLGKNICYLHSTASTNDVLVRLAEHGAGQGTVVLADHQTAGRGRSGRKWSAPAGSGLLFSYLLYPEIKTERMPLIMLAAAVGTARGLERVTGIRPGIKWPNDIRVAGKKVSGILAEARLGENQQGSVVVGIGINVHIEEHEWPKELQNTATSLFQLTGEKSSRGEILQAVCEENEVELDRLYRGEHERVVQNWLAYSETIGQEVDVFLPGENFRGTACDITPTGGLVVRDGSGSLRTIYMGDISIRHVHRG